MYTYTLWTYTCTYDTTHIQYSIRCHSTHAINHTPINSHRWSHIYSYQYKMSETYQCQAYLPDTYSYHSTTHIYTSIYSYTYCKLGYTCGLNVVQVGRHYNTFQSSNLQMFMNLSQSTHITTLTPGTDWIPLILSVLKPYQILK